MLARDRAFVEKLRGEELAGATAIVAEAAAYLAAARLERRPRLELARACAAAQPAMAGLLKIVAYVRDEHDPTASLSRLHAQVRGAGKAIARLATDLLLLEAGPSSPAPRPLTIVTISASAAVEATLLSLATKARLTARCPESRPGCEGTALATRLATAGIQVDLFTDAGISSGLAGGDALLLGADAVGPEHFVNKVGTGALCALANAIGVPAYVLASREKHLEQTEFNALSMLERPWDIEALRSLDTLRVRNPIFERVPRHWVSAVVSDAGIM